MYKPFCGYRFSLFLSKYLEGGWPRYMVSVCLTLNKTAKLFLKLLNHFAFLSAVYESPSCSVFLQHLVLSAILTSAMLVSVQQYLIWAVNLYFLMATHVEHVFIWLCNTCITYFLKYLYNFFCPFLIELSVFLLSLRTLRLFWMKIHYQIVFYFFF